MSVTRSAYVAQVKAHLGIHVTNHGFWLAWCLAESGTEPCTGQSGRGAHWNPLNTTWELPGATKYNAVGVRNYPTEADGILAESSTLRLSYYAELVAACRRGAPLGHLANLLAHSPYGTGQAIWAGIDAYKRDPAAAGRLPVG
jgi:hypothetical protein